MDIELKLREILLPVFGFDSIDQIQPQHSLVMDLKAESIDFVEIIYLVEQNFGVVLDAREIINGAASFKTKEIFKDGKLTAEGTELLKSKITEGASRIRVGMTKVDIFMLLTVHDLAEAIKNKLEKGNEQC